jgi:putative nucleotidyltransferase with HDIG domain
MLRFSGETLVQDAVGWWRSQLQAAPSGALLTLSPLDRSTVDHMGRVERLAGEAAAWLGLDPKRVRVVQRAALLHDLGKLVIPPSILNKPAKLTAAEWKVMRRHPEIGADLLSRLGETERVCETVVAHHERWDGGGYPTGLAGSDIPIEARLLAVVDAYDTMTNYRPYRGALNHDEAIEELNLGSGNQFDPVAVEAVEAALTLVPGKDFGSPLQAVLRRRRTRPGPKRGHASYSTTIIASRHRY